MYQDRRTVSDLLVLDASLAYDLAASSYDGWRWQWFWHQTETLVFDDVVASRFAGRRPDMLDVGCGTGFYLSRYWDRCARMV